MKIKPFLLAIVVAVIAACHQGPVVVDTKGQRYGLSDLRGKWIFVNYWASWCPSCQHEIPELNAFNKSIQGKNAVLLSVNYDALPKEELVKLKKELKIDFPVLTSDPKDYYGVDDISGLPTTIVINPNGVVAGVLLGGQTFSELHTFVEKKGIS